MNNNPTFYIHIGLMKTGTTSIQHYLHKNRKKLRNQNILFPDGTKYGKYIRHRSWLPKQNPNYEKVWNDTIKKSKGYERVVISAEGFSFLSEEDIRKIQILLSSHKVKIIAYFRRYDHFIKSWYQERVKSQEEILSLEDFTSKALERMNYSEIVKKWSDTFGFENMIPRIYEPFGFDSIKDFCSILSIKTEYLEDLKMNKNIGFSDSMVMLKHHINTIEDNTSTLKYLSNIMRQNRHLMKDDCNRNLMTLTENQYDLILNQVSSIKKTYQWDFSSLIPPYQSIITENLSSNSCVSIDDIAFLVVNLAKKSEKYESLSNNSLLKPIIHIRRFLKKSYSRIIHD